MSSHLHSHFATLDQQEDTAEVGMWIFLASEVLFFGALFCGYLVYRSQFPEAWRQGSQLNDAPLATAMTAILLTSSLTMALAVQSAQRDRLRRLVAMVGLTALLGAAFLALKFSEYHHHFEHNVVPGLDFSGYHGPDPGHVQLFMSFYFVMTGFHALHMIIGLGLFAALIWMTRQGRVGGGRHAPVENVGLYWHFVDSIWIFLFPLLYLIG